MKRINTKRSSDYKSLPYKKHPFAKLKADQ